jgi:hypothetical protein
MGAARGLAAGGTSPGASAPGAAGPAAPPPPPPFAPAGATDSGAGVHPLTLAFRAPGVEAGYLREVAAWRAPVLAAVFTFDCLAFAFRIAAKLAGRRGKGQRLRLGAGRRTVPPRARAARTGAAGGASKHRDARDSPCPKAPPLTPSKPAEQHPPAPHQSRAPAAPPPRPACGSPLEAAAEMAYQLANMASLYLVIGLLNRRARRAAPPAPRAPAPTAAAPPKGAPAGAAPPPAAVWQEETLLSALMAAAVCNLLVGLGPENSADYVYVSYFLIATTTFLKIRWCVWGALLRGGPPHGRSEQMRGGGRARARAR